MCGIAGFSLCKAETGGDDQKLYEVSQLLTLALLKEIEHRGHDATGAAWFEDDAKGHEQLWVMKDSITATKWLDDWKWMGVRSDTALLHTRAGTGGNQNVDNHPIVTPNVIGVHNGILYNDDQLFKELEYKRLGEVDSEILFQMIGDKKQGIKGVVEKVHGDAAIGWCEIGDTKHTLRLANLGGRPLEIGMTVKGSLVFASEWKAIEKACEFIGEHVDKVSMDIATKAVDTDGKMYTIRRGKVVKQEDVGSIVTKRYQDYTNTYMGRSRGVIEPVSRTSSYSTASNKVTFRCRNYPKTLRPTAFASSKCPDCGCFASCVCRFNRAPLPAYPARNVDWEEHEGVANGVEMMPANEGHISYPKWRVVGGQLVPPAEWRKWVDKILDFDEEERENQLIQEGTIDGDLMEGVMDFRNLPYGNIVQWQTDKTDNWPGGVVYAMSQGPGTPGRWLNRVQVVEAMTWRMWRDEDDHGNYLIRTLSELKENGWPKSGDTFMHLDNKTNNVWRMCPDGTSVTVGTWEDLYEPADHDAQWDNNVTILTPPTITGDKDEEDMTTDEFDVAVSAMLARANAEPVEDEADDYLLAAFGITDFGEWEEITHSFLVKREEGRGHRVEYLVHWRSKKRVTLLCEDGARVSYDMDATLVSRTDGNNATEDNTDFMMKAVLSGRAVAEELQGNGQENSAWYAAGEEIERFDLERELPLRGWEYDDKEIVDA